MKKIKELFEELPHDEGTVIFNNAPETSIAVAFQDADEEPVDDKPVTVDDCRDIIVDLIDEDDVDFEETTLLTVIGYLLDYLEDSDEDGISYVIQQLNIYAGLENTDDSELDDETNMEIPPSGYEMGSDGSTDIDEMDDGSEGTEDYTPDGELTEAIQMRIRHGKKVRTRPGFRKSAHGGFKRISRATLMKMKRGQRKRKGKHLKASTKMKMKRSRIKTMRRFGSFIKREHKKH